MAIARFKDLCLDTTDPAQAGTFCAFIEPPATGG